MHQFVTESSYFAGPDFQLDRVMMQVISDRVAEMDNNNVVQLDPSTYKYAQGLRQLFRDIEDPFVKEISQEVTFETKAIG